MVGGDGLPTGAYRYYTQALCRGTTEERWGTVYIGATSCTVKRATRADLRLTPLSLPLAPYPTRRRSLALSFPFSIPLAPLFSSPPSLSPTLSRLSCRARSDAAQLPLAGLTQPNPRANFIPRRLTTTDGRRRVLDAAVAVVVVVVVVRHRTRSRDTSTWSSANRCFDVRASFSYPSVFSSSCRRWCISVGSSSRYYCDRDIRDWILRVSTVLTDSRASRKLRGRVEGKRERQRVRLIPFSLGGGLVFRTRTREGERTDHGHVRGLLGTRGTAPRGLRGTTPATARSRFPDSAARGE